MTGTLTKRLITKTTRIPGSPGSPGDPGQPYIPPRFITVTETVCNVSISGVVGYYVPFDASSPSRDLSTPHPTPDYTDKSGQTYVFIPSAPAAPGAAGEVVCKPVTRTYRDPGQPYRAPLPPTPPQPSIVKKQVNQGWTGGAHTNHVLADSGYVTFTVPKAVGAVVGLTFDDLDTLPTEATHGFYFGSGKWQIIEAGVRRNVFASRTASMIYKIERRTPTVLYYVNDALVYESDEPSFGPVVLDAALYFATDSVVCDEHVDYGDGIQGASLPAAGIYGDEYQQMVGVTPRPTAAYIEVPVSRMTGAAPSIYGLMSDYEYAFMKGSARGPTADLNDADFPQPDYGYLLQLSASAFGVMIGTEPETGQMTGTAHAADGIYADYPYGQMIGAANVTAEGYMAEGAFGEADMFSAVAMNTPWTPTHYIAIAFNSSGAIMGSIDLLNAIDARMDSTMAADFSAQLSAILGATFDSSLGVSDRFGNTRYDTSGGGMPQRSEDAKTWVINFDTKAVSTYTGYDFDRMYEQDGSYYGTRDGGVYLLAGDDDAGAPIDAFVDFGRQTFGDAALKHVPTFYAGVSSTGALLLRVDTGKEVFTYDARRNDQHMRQQRFDLGKGLRATYYEFQLFNQAGAEFELDSVEFMAIPSARRI